ncbi:MAG TPA: GNAT family N-acetyltransferase [Streptosporangiaceae bacterium]|jgi:ribosomal protein S18 acetylase RimI-like enzyme
MATGPTLSELTARQFLGQLETSLAIYADAMDAEPLTLPGRRELMRRHAGYPAFRAFQARNLSDGRSAGRPASRPADQLPDRPADQPDQPHQPPAQARTGFRDLVRPKSGKNVSVPAPALAPATDSQVVGFAYGFHGQAGQWWYDAVWHATSRSLGAGRAAVWLADSFEIAEVHVRKEFQRGGIGTAMLLSLTADRPERTAVLSTPDRDSTARRLYRRLGFTELLTGYSFPGGSPPYIVMGAELPLRTEAGELTRSPEASPSIS